MSEYVRAEGTTVERLEAYKSMLLARMDSLMSDIERLALQVEQVDIAIAEETPVPEMTEEEQFVRGTQ